MEQEARKQRRLRENAQHENINLKLLIDEQTEYSQMLIKLLHKKKPKLFHMKEGEAWRMNRLVADKIDRASAIDNIINREYKYLSTVLLQVGLYDNEQESISQDRILNADSYKFETQVVRQAYYPEVDFRLCGNLAFYSLDGCSVDVVPVRDGAFEMNNIERVNENTNYIEFLSGQQAINIGPRCCGRSICRKIEEKNRTIIIWRGIVEDELHSSHYNALPLVSTAWLIAENVPSLKEGVKDGTRVKFISKATPAGDFTNHLQKYSMSTKNFAEVLLHNYCDGVDELTQVMSAMAKLSL